MPCSETRIPVDGSEAVLTVWDGGNHAGRAILLVPGWGGGPRDQFGIGEALSPHGIHVVVLSPRGWHGSSGTASFAHGIEDISAALDWTRAELDRPVILGGHSWGGGLSLCVAARDRSIERVFALSGTDHAIFIRRMRADPAYAARLGQTLGATAAPEGPIRFSVEEILEELDAGQATYGLLERAPALADRSILLVGGCHDTSVTVDETVRPLFQALQHAGADDVTLRVLDTDHAFSGVRPALHATLLAWVHGVDQVADVPDGPR